MRVIDPRAISLKSTSVTANAEPEWSATTTYGLGDSVQVTSAVPHTVYESLRGDNTNRVPGDWLQPAKEIGSSTTSLTIGNGAKTMTTQTNLSFSPGMIVAITKTATPKTIKMTGEVTAYDSATGQLDVTVYSITGEGTHATWTVTSEDEIGFWREIGSTNQYAMFDKYVNTQTEEINEIYVKLDVERVDYIALFGLDAKNVELELWDTTETTLLWSGEIDLVYVSAVIAAISDWFEYFFGEFSAKNDATADIAVITYAGVLCIRITAESGSSARCGSVIVGRSFDIGITQYDASAGMVDFSTRDTDNLGRTTVTKGYWAKRNSVKLRIENYKLDAVYKLLAGLRGTPTAWSANNPGIEYESLVIYGIFKDFDVVLAGATHSWCNIEIEGLI